MNILVNVDLGINFVCREHGPIFTVVVLYIKAKKMPNVTPKYTVTKNTVTW